jgi:CRP-like cAMP-binding protein
MVIEIEFLKKLSYFERLGHDELDLVLRLIFENKFERGEIIIAEGDSAHALYFVSSGAVKTFTTSVDGKEQVLNILRPGESFNEVAIFDNGPNLASVRAMGSVSVCGILKRDLLGFLEYHPQIALSAVNILSAQMRHFVSLIDDLSFKPVVARVAKILNEYLGNGEGPTQKLTQQDMAAIAGTARELVGRSLKTLEKNGLIKFDRHRIVITNREALKNLAGVSL